MSYGNISKKKKLDYILRKIGKIIVLGMIQNQTYVEDYIPII